jgi:death-on-curing protein
MIYTIHDQQLAQHGGHSRISHEELIISALNRPMQLDIYKKPDIADLVAVYAYGIIKNHEFVDGNK